VRGHQLLQRSRGVGAKLMGRLLEAVPPPLFNVNGWHALACQCRCRGV